MLKRAEVITCCPSGAPSELLAELSKSWGRKSSLGMLPEDLKHTLLTLSRRVLRCHAK
jgi:hypothetical protein